MLRRNQVFHLARVVAAVLPIALISACDFGGGAEESGVHDSAASPMQLGFFAANPNAVPVSDVPVIIVADDCHGE